MNLPDPDMLRRQKRAAAVAAVAEVEAGMVVGLGTGSTAQFAIEALAARVAAGLAVCGVATSLQIADAARALGIAVIDLPPDGSVDLAIDGVDEIDARLRAIKGAGGALLREKIVGTAARRMIAIADATKPVEQLGGRPVPLEILDFARPLIERDVVRLGGRPRLRGGDQAPARTDQGNILLDCDFGPIDDPAVLAAALSAIPGMLGHGLFVTEIDALYVGAADGSAVKRARDASGAFSLVEQAHP